MQEVAHRVVMSMRNSRPEVRGVSRGSNPNGRVIRCPAMKHSSSGGNRVGSSSVGGAADQEPVCSGNGVLIKWASQRFVVVVIVNRVISTRPTAAGEHLQSSGKKGGADGRRSGCARRGRRQSIACVAMMSARREVDEERGRLGVEGVQR